MLNPDEVLRDKGVMNTDYKSIPLNPLRAFAVASRHKTFTAAAKQMGITQVAISRQIAILENYLGVKLFERGPRQVKLTEVGRAFGQEIAPLFDSIEEATRAIFVAERDRIVSLRAYPTFAHYWLLPRMPSFRAAWPDLDIRLDTTVEPLDFRGTQLEVAIQLGDGDWRDTRARKLFDEELDAVCSPEYAAKNGNFASTQDLANASLLHARYRRREWEKWADAQALEIDTQDGYEFDSSLLTYSAAVNGLGVAIGQLELLSEEIAQNRLVRPFDRRHKTGSAFWVVWPSTRSVSAKTKRLIDWLLVQAGQKPEFYKSGGEA